MSFTTAIRDALAKHGISQTELATQQGIPISEMSRIMKGKRPNAAAFRALCTAWPDADTGLLVLHAHLQDEVRRAGCSLSQIQPYLTGGKFSSEVQQVEQDLHTILEFLAKNPDMRSVLHTMAETVRKGAK